jgi:hypothetical protein
MFNAPEGEWGVALEGWRGLDASHVSFNSMGVGIDSPQGHIDAIRRFMETTRGT